MLEDNSKSKIENLEKNLRSMVDKCHNYGVKNVFISGLVYTTRIGLPVLERTHEMIVHLYYKLGVCYVDNRNIRRKYLWKDGLHLVESGKVILANNFWSYLSKCFFNTHTSSGGIYLDDNIRNTKLLQQTWKCSKMVD